MVLSKTLGSTLADLPTHNFQVSPQVLGEVIARQLEKHPSLPGVIIIIDDNIVLGAFSRRKFLEQVGQHYGVAVYPPAVVFLCGSPWGCSLIC